MLVYKLHDPEVDVVKGKKELLTPTWSCVNGSFLVVRRGDQSRFTSGHGPKSVALHSTWLYTLRVEWTNSFRDLHLKTDQRGKTTDFTIITQ